MKTMTTRYLKRNHYKILFFNVLCFSNLIVLAQQPVSLSLDSAIKYAVVHNRSLVNSKLAIDRSSQKIRETIAQGLPQISATVDYTNYLGAEATLQLSPSSPPAVIEFKPTSNFTASATQLIFNGNYYIGIQLTKLAKVLTEKTYENDEANVKEQTFQAYYTILVSERLMELIKDNEANARSIYEKSDNLAKAGVIEPVEVKKLSVMVTAVENALKSTERQTELGYNLLRLQLGIDENVKINLTSNLEEITGKYIQSAKFGTFNVQNNPVYMILETQGKMAEKNVLLAKASYLPSLVSYYSYTEKIKKPLFDITPKNVVGLTLSVPVFSSGQRHSQLSQARIDQQISENSKELLSQQLTVQARQLQFNYNNLLEQYLNQKSNSETAKEVLDKMKLKYGQGLISSLELTSANSEYITAETNFTGTLLQLLFAELSLRKINNEL